MKERSNAFRQGSSDRDESIQILFRLGSMLAGDTSVLSADEEAHSDLSEGTEPSAPERISTSAAEKPPLDLSLLPLPCVHAADCSCELAGVN
jgi:hypothetical protein